MKYANRPAITFRRKFKRDRGKSEIRLADYYMSFSCFVISLPFIIPFLFFSFFLKFITGSLSSLFSSSNDNFLSVFALDGEIDGEIERRGNFVARVRESRSNERNFNRFILRPTELTRGDSKPVKI